MHTSTILSVGHMYEEKNSAERIDQEYLDGKGVSVVLSALSLPYPSC